MLWTIINYGLDIKSLDTYCVLILVSMYHTSAAAVYSHYIHRIKLKLYNGSKRKIKD